MDREPCGLQISTWGGGKLKARSSCARGWFIMFYVDFFNANGSECKHLLFKIYGGLIVEEMPF